MRRALALAAGLLLVTSATLAAPEINEGALQVLPEPPAEPAHHHHKHLTISAESLDTGWVTDRQCHYQLDQVGAMEVTFAPGRVRALEIARAEHIEKAWVEGSSVQLKNVGPNAVLCIHSENRILERDPSTGAYLLTSGPYMRRFLDGYFPLRVSLQLDYPAQLLVLKEIDPPEIRPHATLRPGQLRLDAWFEGRLVLRLTFVLKNPK
ncbi:MAG: hypothetical protein HY942_02405 [Gammaproteobacteria bacterium]|nr:hypothetical protein [Gammaproteobacteria bacterium]